MPTLTLYHLPYCPYCHLVRREAHRLGIQLELLDVSEHPDAREHLVANLGRGTVPVLGIDDALLPESADIVRWLRNHAERVA